MFGVIAKVFRQPALKIEAGREYRMRSGNTTTIVMEDHDSPFWFFGYYYRDQNGRSYNSAGRMYHQHRFDDPDKESQFDIVEYA